MSNIEIAFEQARGQWPRILQAAGISKLFLTRRAGPCPMCGGVDRFSFDNRRDCGDYICRQCGGGDGIVLLRKYRGWSFREAFQHIEKFARSGTADPAPDAPVSPWRGPAVKQTTPREFWAMARLWGRGVRTTPQDPIGLYLARRAIGLSPRVVNLRTVVSRDQTCAEMLARVQDPDGRVVQLHRTIVGADGLRHERRLMPGVHPAGSAVRLYEGAAKMGVAEGIETALAAACMFQIPVWAALNANRLAKFNLPDYVEQLAIFGDHDENGTGQRAAHELAAKAKGRGVKVTVHIPQAPDADWNDLLANAMAGAAFNPSQ